MSRKSWSAYFMDMAKLVASRSKDPTTKVGCVVVTADKIAVSTGYNGIPRGVMDNEHRLERPAKYLWTSHAEENAIAQAARIGARLEGATAFVTHHPCARCARSLIQAGIKEVVIGHGQTSMPSEEFEVAAIMFLEAGVYLRRLQP